MELQGVSEAFEGVQAGYMIFHGIPAGFQGVSEALLECIESKVGSGVFQDCSKGLWEFQVVSRGVRGVPW